LSTIFNNSNNEDYDHIFIDVLLNYILEFVALTVFVTYILDVLGTAEGDYRKCYKSTVSSHVIYLLMQIADQQIQ